MMRVSYLLLMTGWLLAQWVCAQAPTVQTEGGLKFQADARGNHLPDYSFCGYAASEQPIPSVPTRLKLEPSGHDDTQRIAAALKQLAGLPRDKDGWHGALELGAGTFHVSGQVELTDEHLVIRGAVDDRGALSTTIIATGKARRALFHLGRPRQPNDPIHQQLVARVAKSTAVGAQRLDVLMEPDVHVKAGQLVKLDIASTRQWIHRLGMDQFPADDNRGSWLDWKPGTLNQSVYRVITNVAGNQITLDAPVMCELDIDQTPVEIFAVDDNRDTKQVGIENLRLISQADRANNPKDEEHAWDAVRVFATDAWVRHIECHNFVGSAVRVTRQSRRVSVIDCKSLEPVSEDGGWRRRSFVTTGGQTLFLRCYAEDGRHDFCVESLAPGPNAFVHCRAVRATQSSGPVGSWCTGVLLDNVEIDGASLELTNLETAGQGIGWTSAYGTLWNCVAPQLVVRQPPSAYNWAVGVWGEVVGDGLWAHLNEFVSPDSLYLHQLSARIGKAQAQSVLSATTTSVMPSADAPTFQWHPSARADATGEPHRHLQLQAGKLVLIDSDARSQPIPVRGARMQLSWWRGSVLPAKVAEFGPGLTRFVPGHDERFFTDQPSDVIDLMQANGHVALDHHWGLWYDRRRDDHQMVRRIDGDVWPPFYEHPWARSGQGTGYDGLSKYDLSRFNPWYFGRLAEFARLADQRGVILIQHMYFQHNILEAGAHWAEFPWRPANCLQATGFPEPPSYQNRKRVFMADDFYDVNHPVRRDLHTRYIRHCLDTLGGYHNVLFVLGEEFTGPAHFMRFWLDTIDQWQQEKQRDVHVVLSATRDVQEAILQEPRYAKLVDVIEIKYWWHTKDGTLYDPAGGQNLAPRQQLREWKGSKARSPESIQQSVHELKSRYPKHVIITNFADSPPFNP